MVGKTDGDGWTDPSIYPERERERGIDGWIDGCVYEDRWTDSCLDGV